MFKTTHIISLILSIIFIVGTVIILKKTKKTMKDAERYALTIGVLSEIVKIAYYIISNEDKYHGYLPKSDLPFHLCSLQIILLFILVISNNQKIKRFIYAFMLPSCLLGGFAALMLPTSSAQNELIITIQYFIYHSTIVAFAVYIYVSGEIQLSLNDYKNALIGLLFMGFIAIYLNSWVADYVQNVNFMYVVGPPMDGLPFLNKNYGWGIYIVHYMFACLFAVSICYIKPILASFKKTSKVVQPE